MTFTNSKTSEMIAILTAIDPAATVASTVLSAYVPVAGYHSFAALLQTGTLGTSATFDAKIRQATDASGTSVKDITGKAITQIVKATGDAKQAVINFRAEDVDTAGGFTHVCISVTVGTATSPVSALLIGVNPRYAPVTSNATVVQAV